MNQEVPPPMNISVNPSVEGPACDRIRIRWPARRRIPLSWSYGEVKKPETINYRTFKPEGATACSARADFSARSRTMNGLCGKSTSASSTRALSARSGGVEVTRWRVCAASAWAISSWPPPVAHIWFLKSLSLPGLTLMHGYGAEGCGACALLRSLYRHGVRA